MLFDWVIDQKEKNERNNGGIIKNKETRGRRLIVDKMIKVCPICESTWEKVRPAMHHGRSVMYYRKGQLPTYGKEKIICEKCK
jgi:hypothetical protein